MIFSVPGYSQRNTNEDNNRQMLEQGLNLLHRYFMQDNVWHVTRPELSENVKGLVHFIEDEPIDSVLHELNRALEDTSSQYVYRLPENVPDSLDVPGYYPHFKLEENIKDLRVELKNDFQKEEPEVPLSLIQNIDEKVDLAEPGEGIELFKDSVYVLPDSLQIPEAVPDTMMQSAEDFQHYLKLDSLRDKKKKKKRVEYNDSIITVYRDSVIQQYRQEQFEEEYAFRKKRLVDSVELNNYQVLRAYNDVIIESVNDSIYYVIETLSDYADYIDTTKLIFTNLTLDTTELVLSSAEQNYARLWLKNQQNDSLSVLTKNLDKHAVQMLIDDGVTFSRFRARETKEFDFSTLSENMAGLTDVGQRYEVNTPWRIGGDGTVGFTQTYLEK